MNLVSLFAFANSLRAEEFSAAIADSLNCLEATGNWLWSQINRSIIRGSSRLEKSGIFWIRNSIESTRLNNWMRFRSSLPLRDSYELVILLVRVQWLPPIALAIDSLRKADFLLNSGPTRPKFLAMCMSKSSDSWRENRFSISERIYFSNDNRVRSMHSFRDSAPSCSENWQQNIAYAISAVVLLIFRHRHHWNLLMLIWNEIDRTVYLGICLASISILKKFQMIFEPQIFSCSNSKQEPTSYFLMVFFFQLAQKWP